MESKYKKNDNVITIFPAMYKDTDSEMIVLFTDETTGTVINRLIDKSLYPLGYYTNNWSKCTNQSCWKRLNPGDIVELVQN